MAGPPPAERAAAGFRCGFVAIVGRPNVGKSTLLNRLVGQKLSITSRKAQTTRTRINGILTTERAQLVFVDTPGFQTQHRSRLNERMNREVRDSLRDVDAIVLVLEAGRTVEADRAVVRLLPEAAQVVAALSKTDRLAERDRMLPQMAELAALRGFAAIVPVCAERGDGVEALVDEVVPLVPERGALYGEDEITDRDERFLAAELIREKIFRLSGDELPYASTVAIERFVHEGELRRIAATVYVERDSQRAILVGAGGERMKEIASAARVDMERLFGGRVFVEIWVRVKRGWADDDALLARLGH